VEGYTSANRQDLNARFDQVGPLYFRTVGIPVVLGREFTPRDGANAPRVCLINETMAKFYFGKTNPIGKHITDEFPDTRTTFEIVGVVKDAKYLNVREETPRRFYVPFFNPLGPISFGHLMIRTNADPAAVTASLRNEIRAIDDRLAVDRVRTVSEQVDRSLVQDRLIAQLSMFFGLLALLLACLGLYGVMSYATARRTPEIGIRMALGAERGAVLRMVLRESMLMVIIGAVLGVPAAIALSQLVASRLYGLQAADPATLVAATCILIAVALAAALIPARRASRVDPLRALRYE
jgi:predicted permease